MLCIIAFIVFSVMSVFSAKHRPLAKEAFTCVFRKMTLRPCETGLDKKIQMKIVSRVFDHSPNAARLINRHFELFSWLFIIISFASLIVVAQGAYNIYLYGTCDPVHPEQCLITGAFGEQPICPMSLEGINVGPSDAKVLIIEFGCFTCSYTAAAESKIQEILSDHPDDVRYVFKTFPIPEHDYSLEAAAASICANEQNKYWEYREKLFGNIVKVQSEGKLYLISLANETGLNTTLFEQCLYSDATIQQIKLMEEEGIESKIKGTPTFFVNHNYVKADDLERVVEEELAK